MTLKDIIEDEREEARAEGREEGREQGLIEGKRLMAKAMLALGKLSISEISVVSGLTEAEIVALNVS